MKRIVVLLLLGLTGCSSRYTQKGTTPLQLKHDMDNCEASANFSTRDLFGYAYEGFMDKCMRGKGWTVDGKDREAE